MPPKGRLTEGMGQILERTAWKRTWNSAYKAPKRFCDECGKNNYESDYQGRIQPAMGGGGVLRKQGEGEKKGKQKCYGGEPFFRKRGMTVTFQSQTPGKKLGKRTSAKVNVS